MTADAAAENCCYLCNECGSNFATLDDLESHMGTAHAVESVPNTASDLDVGKSRDSVDDATDRTANVKTTAAAASNDGEHSPSSSDSSMIDGGATASLKGETGSLLGGVGGEDDDGDGGSVASSTPVMLCDDQALALQVQTHICRFCNKSFKKRELLNIHYTHTHRDKPQYECEVCFKVFSVKRELATHRRVHSGEQTHICAQCGKEFGTRQLLKKHWMWHTGERSHVCPHCGKAFFQKGHLTQHLMIHAGGRPHVCHLCQKTFIFKFDLNRHMKIHAERGYSCEKCGRAFLKQNSLIDHAAKCRGGLGTPASATNGATPVGGVETSSPSSRSASALSSTPTMVTSGGSGGGSVDVTPIMGGGGALSAGGVLGRQLLPPPPLQLQQGIFQMATPTPSPVSNGQDISNSSDVKPQTSPLNIMHSSQQPLQQQQQQQPVAVSIAQAAAAAAQQQQFPPQQFFCFLCMRPFASQAAYTLHLSFVHFRNAMFPQPQQQQQQLSTGMQNETLLTNHLPNAVANMDTSGGGVNHAKVSPVVNGVASSEPFDHQHVSSDHQPSTTSASDQCDGCASLARRGAEMERAVAVRDAEIGRLKETLGRVSGTAGGLLESCTDFDKLWMLHSKKVYTQIQSILNQIE